MYSFYRLLTRLCGPVFSVILKSRAKHGKETRERSLLEKSSIISRERPSPYNSKLLWIHAASVGEAQSAIILIDRISKEAPDINILVTTGTLTSATMMEKHLTDKVIHQFYPLDHPDWVENFLNHWHPNAVLWMESELWPNMLHSMNRRLIPVILVNARMSEKSFNMWRRFPSMAKQILDTFDKVLCQTTKDKDLYDKLGAKNTIVTDNLKYSAKPLSFNKEKHNALINATKAKDIWLYASTHDGEEQLACEIHKRLRENIPSLLTIIVPRHPERRKEILNNCASSELNIIVRGEDDNNLPSISTDIYIADTLGELGLFYSISPVTCIGRSFSKDGGGGHNPIEAAQYGCAILHGPNVQNLKSIYDEMHSKQAAICVSSPDEMEDKLAEILSNHQKRTALQRAALIFSKEKIGVIDIVMDEIAPVINFIS